MAATRWGIFGASKIAHDFVVAMKTLPQNEHRLVAVASRSLERASEFAEKHSLEKAYGSYEELARDDNVEIVYVSTIHPNHAKLCKLALNHGKHVLCEKPLTMNLKDSKEVLELAKSKGLFLMEAMWTRFFPIYADVKRLIDSNALGEIKVATISFGSNIEANERLQEPDLGGGVLLDLGTYCLHIADMMFDGEEPEKIHAVGHKTDKGVDATVSVTLLYKRGRVVSFTITMTAQLPNEATFSGSYGSVTIHSPFHCATHFSSLSGKKEYSLPEPCMPLNFTNSTGMRYEIDGVRRSLLEGHTESPVMPHSASLRVFGWMDEIRRQIGVVYKDDA